MLTTPKTTPHDYGFKAGDFHIIVNASTESAKCFDSSGKQLWKVPALATGQQPNWREWAGDTPPGVYKLGTAYNDYEIAGESPEYDRTLMSYGWVTFDMIDLEGNEDGNDRAGICLHGGGSGCGWPSAWHAQQALYPTYGCVRMHNQDLRDRILPLTQTGTVFLSVYQDDI